MMWSILRIPTPLGEVLVGASPSALYFLGFVDSPLIVRRFQNMQQRIGPPTSDLLDPLAQMQEEMDAYFSGSLQQFRTPLVMEVTPFQSRVYELLREVPFGQTTHYQALARQMGQPSAFRAVAQAHRANPFHILVPCHRTLYADGRLGGYQAGLERKKDLLEHEAKWKVI